MVMVMVIGYLTLIQEICSVVEACLGVDDCPDEEDGWHDGRLGMVRLDG